MARQGYWAYITPVSRPGGGPVDPGYGVEGPETQPPGYPDQGLPPGFWGGERPDRPPGFWGGERPGWEHPGNRPPGSWGGEHPGNRPPGSWPGRPDQGLPRPPHLWPRPPGGGLPVDPGWGVPEGGHPDHGLPIYPVDPTHPDNSLPPVEGEGPPPTDPPPGTIWPPLPPEIPEGKVIALVAISGVGYRYTVLTVPPHKPDQGLPRPPGRPDQGLPPTAAPKRA